MVTESVAILAVTICMILLFIRAGHGDYAASLIPLLIVPFMHMLAVLTLHAFHGIFVSIPYALLVSFADIIGLAISCLLIIVFSNKVKSKKNKRLYIVLLTGYNILLTCAFVWQILQPLVMAQISIS